MKHLKKFESIRDEYPGMFEPISEEDKPKDVPGFDGGTIDPDDDEVYGEPFPEISQKEQYETIFLKLIKERNFDESTSEIKINIHRLGQDYCMSIYNAPTHLKKFLNDELIGKYISGGFVDVMEDYDIDDTKGNVQGIIERVISVRIDSMCNASVNLKIKGYSKTSYTTCLNVITLDKEKTNMNKYNL